MYRLLLLVGFVATSCAPTYISNSRNVPMFADGGEFAGSVAVSSGVDLQGAYSLSDHVALMANVNVLSQKSTTEDGESFTRKNTFAEGGLGYFTRTKTMRTEIFAGYGMGSRTSYEALYFFRKANAEPLIADGKYSRIFFQPSISTNKRKFNIAFTARFSMVNFTEFKTKDPGAASPTFKPTDGLQLFIEPAITTRFHLVGNLRGFFQLGLNRPVPDDVYYTFVPLQAAVGIQIHTGQLRTRVY
ncbi:MAG TPA: hypothetical protein VFE50_16245 [Cyclobacteriaceae bacterium]|nr:hypothetical protein [Cyclobacteriaceae bacterium]